MVAAAVCPRRATEGGISGHGGDAVGLAEPVVWEAACPLCRGRLTTVPKWLPPPPSLAGLV